MQSLFQNIITLALFATSTFAQAPAAPANASATAQAANEWPQTTQVDGATYTVNQPSFTGLSSNTVTMRSVVQVSGDGSSAKSGTVTMTAVIAPADVAGLVEVNSFKVTGADGSIDANASAALEKQLQGMAFTIPLASLVQDITVDTARNEKGLSNATPDIVVTGEGAVLVSVAGSPVLSPLGSTGWKRVTNTPFILLESSDKSWWVRLGKSTWMKAAGMTERYAPAGTAPPQPVIDALGAIPTAPANLQQDIERVGAPTPKVPAVLVVTRPTVLVSINGAMQLRPIAPGINEVMNANQLVLVRDASPRNWVLASGRWFSCDTLNGPWTYVPPTQLPGDFAKFSPSGLRMSSALASVPGTRQAKEAAVSTNLVRTIVLNRAKAACDVSWSGVPAWQPVQNTSMQYALNASQPVIALGDKFYCCDNAAWFQASTATGPWTLCDSVPSDIYTIPASCPIYPCTFVEVYGSTQDTVTFGFTAGYMGSYMQDGAAVFGTGYDYATTTNSDGSTSTYPQTYGSQASYDEDSGTWAPPGYDDAYGDYYPGLYPDVYADGWGGWGCYGGYGAAYGYGYGNSRFSNALRLAYARNRFLNQDRLNQANLNARAPGGVGSFNRADNWSALNASSDAAGRWNRANGVVQVNPSQEEAREQREVLGPNREADARRDFGYHPTGFHPSYQGGGHAAPAPGGGGGRR